MKAIWISTVSPNARIPGTDGIQWSSTGGGSKSCSCGRASSKQRKSWNVWHPERFKHSRVKVDSSTSWKATWFQQKTSKQSIAVLSWLLVFSWCCSILAFLRLAAGYTWIALLGASPPQRHRWSSPCVSLRNHTVSDWTKSEEKEKWYDHMISLDIWCETSFWNFLVLTCWTCKLSWAAVGQEFSVWQHQLIRYRFTSWIWGSLDLSLSNAAIDTTLRCGKEMLLRLPDTEETHESPFGGVGFLVLALFVCDFFPEEFWNWRVPGEVPSFSELRIENWKRDGWMLVQKSCWRFFIDKIDHFVNDNPHWNWRIQLKCNGCC